MAEESAKHEKMEESQLKNIRATLAKAMAEFKKAHPGAQAEAHVRHGNNRHSFDEEGNLNADPNSGDMFPGVGGPQTPKEMATVAHKLYPGMK